MKAGISTKPLHRRWVDNRSWLHDDGALEIESRLVDTRGHDSRVGLGRRLPAGEAVHDMTIRVVLEPDLKIRDIQLQMPHTPFDICPEVVGAFEGLRGERMGRGWNALLSQRFSGAGGCRHLIDLLRGMATVAFQSLHRDISFTPEVVSQFGDSCYAFRKDGLVMKRLLAQLTPESADTDI